MAITKDLVGWNSWNSGPLRSGPMLGEVGEDDAFIWAQARDTSKLTLTLYQPNNSTLKFTATPATTDGLCVVFHAAGLIQGIKYEYDIASQHGKTPRYHLHAALPKHARRARIVFGSCYDEYKNNNLKIFASMAQEQSDLFLMTGDNSYFKEAADWQNEDNMMLVHLRHRNNDALRQLIPNVSVLGIWDDHDFGGNNFDSTFNGKGNALSAFKHMWAQRSYGTAGTAGIFSTVRCGPVEVFLTDGRYYRVNHNHILGATQLQWLKDKLLSSTAPVKLVVSGSVVLPEFVTKIKDEIWDGWHYDAPGELSSLLAHIEAHDIKGVLFISGDLHLGYLMHQPGRSMANGKRGPDYWELVSSPLATGAWTTHVKVAPATPIYDPGLLEEVAALNYGYMDVNLDRTGQEIRLSLKTAYGSPFFEQHVALNSLRTRPAVIKLSAVVWPNGKAYFFRGNKYIRYDIKADKTDDNYPKLINQNWPGLWPNDLGCGLDAAVVWPNDKAYFFKGNSYIRYDIDDDKADAGYPTYISSYWSGLWSEGIDAALVWNNGKAYFFKGPEYMRYDIAADKADAGYPQPINGKVNGKELWPGLGAIFPDGIDAVIAWPNGKAYFFKGTQYVRYTMNPAHEGVDAGYPKPIKQFWPGLDLLGGL